jgi:DNA-binding MarR family transcriptional regulator
MERAASQVRQTVGVRLQRGVLIGGIDPERARELARACHHGWVSTREVAAKLKLAPEDTGRKLRRLEDAGFLERRDGSFTGETDEWNATVSGGALTMAKFLKPISRARADTLLAGVLERAAGYDADEAKPYVISEMLVFGSYLRPDEKELGDLDLAVTFAERQPGSATPDALLDYAHGSGRRFPHIVAAAGWAQTELLRLLRKGSGYINVHTEDVSKITDSWQIVYPQPTHRANS